MLQSLQTDTKRQKHKGAGKPGKEKRRHVHLISAEDRGRTGVSGFRDNATMVVAIDAFAAMRAGVRFLQQFQLCRSDTRHYPAFCHSSL